MKCAATGKSLMSTDSSHVPIKLSELLSLVSGGEGPTTTPQLSLFPRRASPQLPTASRRSPFVSVVSPFNDININLAIEEAVHRASKFHPEYYTADGKAIPGVNDEHGETTVKEHQRKSELRGLLLSYINDPCVVVGRNQNVCKECNVGHLVERDIALARRVSGGGAVYHDAGNVNLSFFSHRKSYAPNKTIILVRDFLRERYNVPLSEFSTTNRHDLYLSSALKKISGSAMKIGSAGCYHHCTLLVSSIRKDLGPPLGASGHYVRVEGNSIDSVRSQVTTLLEEEQIAPKLLEEWRKMMRDRFPPSGKHEPPQYDEKVLNQELAMASMMDFSGFYSTFSQEFFCELAASCCSVEGELAGSRTAQNSLEPSCFRLLDTPEELFDTKFVDFTGRKPSKDAAVFVGDHVRKARKWQWRMGDCLPFTTVVRMSAVNVMERAKKCHPVQVSEAGKVVAEYSNWNQASTDLALRLLLGDDLAKNVQEIGGGGGGGGAEMADVQWEIATKVVKGVVDSVTVVKPRAAEPAAVAREATASSSQSEEDGCADNHHRLSELPSSSITNIFGSFLKGFKPYEQLLAVENGEEEAPVTWGSSALPNVRCVYEKVAPSDEILTRAIEVECGSEALAAEGGGCDEGGKHSRLTVSFALTEALMVEWFLLNGFAAQ